MANYFTITASFFGDRQVINHLKVLMEHFESLCDLSQVDCDEDWLPLIFSNETLEQLGDDYYLSVFSEGYDPHEQDVPDLNGWEIDDEEDGVITLFARGKTNPASTFAEVCARRWAWVVTSVPPTSATRNATTSSFILPQIQMVP